MKMTKKIFISGIINAKTGLHIGGSSVGMSIGNTDNTVIRNPLTNEPYIPGSSIRGKMRSLLERLEGKFTPMGNDINFGPLTDQPDHIICQVFGLPAEKTGSKPPSRLIVRDGSLLNADILLASKETDMPYTEVKTEVVIDRVTSTAMPRQIERVPAGAKFNLNLVLNIWEGDNEDDYINLIFKGLLLLQNDYIGGHGGRGSGQIKITDLMFNEKTITEYEQNLAPKPKVIEIPAELTANA